MADLTCRIELSFLLAVELTKLEDALEQQISPSAIPEPNEEEVDMVMLDYVAYLLNRYHLGQRVPRLASTRVEVDVAEARHGLKPTHWTLFPDKSITKIDPHDGMEYINTVRGTIPHCKLRSVS